MTRRCSHCSNNGHNSRTCPTRAGGGVRLFGVRISDGGGGGVMKKSASVGCLSQYSSFAPSASRDRNGSPASDLAEGDAAGYASDDPNHASCSSNRRGERKKGTPWTEDEHRLFLLGLQKLGKGDWRGIARNYVVTRTPTQVASHAQKYFIRQSNSTRRKRRSSLFDMVPDMLGDQGPRSFMQRSASETDIANSLPSLDLTLDLELSPTDHAADKPVEEHKEHVPCADLPPLVPRFCPTYLSPVPYPFWPSVPMPVKEEDATREVHEVLKPTPVSAKDHTHAEELVGLSNLVIGDAVANRIEPSALSSKLLSPSSMRQSAFHANPATTGADMSLNNGSAIHAL